MLRNWPIIVLIFWLVAVALSAFADLRPDAINLSNILHGPDTSAWLGYDDLGRDILSRILAGAQISMIVAIVVTAVTLSIGVTLGLVAGFFGGWVDRFLMQVTDIFLAFPGILLAIAFAAVLGPGLNNLILALSLTSWVGYARLTRAQALSLRNRQHVQAAAGFGEARSRHRLWHLMPLPRAPG